MAVRLKFKHQKFQENAAESVCAIFAGQDKNASEYDSAGNIPGILTGYGNAEITLSDAQILANLQDIQRANGLNPSNELDKDGRVFTVEMETGTGKTYTYLKTIHELHRRYSWGKYIVVVPSIAIREGVRKTFAITEQHFKEDYDSPASAFIYDSSDMGRVRSFVSNPSIDIMIINTQAFNASKAEARRIKIEDETLSYRKPVDVIAEVRPIGDCTMNCVKGKSTGGKANERGQTGKAQNQQRLARCYARWCQNTGRLMGQRRHHHSD